MWWVKAVVLCAELARKQDNEMWRSLLCPRVHLALCIMRKSTRTHCFVYRGHIQKNPCNSMYVTNSIFNFPRITLRTMYFWTIYSRTLTTATTFRQPGSRIAFVGTCLSSSPPSLHLLTIIIVGLLMNTWNPVFSKPFKAPQSWKLWCLQSKGLRNVQNTSPVFTLTTHK